MSRKKTWKFQVITWVGFNYWIIKRMYFGYTKRGLRYLRYLRGLRFQDLSKRFDLLIINWLISWKGCMLRFKVKIQEVPVDLCKPNWISKECHIQHEGTISAISVWKSLLYSLFLIYILIYRYLFYFFIIF